MAAQPLHLGWHNPVKVHWGAGCLQELAVNHPVLVLADRAALGHDEEARLAAQLGSDVKGWFWFHGGLASVELAQRLCTDMWPVMRQHPDAELIAIGGGSTLDLAKVVRCRMADVDRAAECWRENLLPPDTHRHLLTLVPTTAGTGSEVTRWATLWDTRVEQPTKISWSPLDGYAQRAFVDPRLSVTCPARLTRDCALDALSHALEAVWNRNATPVSDALAMGAARLILRHLPDLLDQPEDLELRSALARASLLAGLAMSQTQTALAHALSYGLTLGEGLPHGEACAVWLPMVWELAVHANPACGDSLAWLFDGPADESPKRLVQWLKSLDVEPRDLRSDPAGRAELQTQLQSARGKNFVATLA